MPDSVREIQLDLTDSIVRMRRQAITIILPLLCLLAVATIIITDDGLSHHVYNLPIYAVCAVWYAGSWVAIRMYPTSEVPYIITFIGCAFPIVTKLITLLLFSTGDYFSIGVMEHLMWLYALLIFALINSTLVFYWRYSLFLMATLSLISLIYMINSLITTEAIPNLMALIQLNSVGWIILIGSKGYMMKKEIQTAHITKMATLERIAHTDILTDLQNRRYLEHYLQDFLEHPQSNILALLFIDIDSFKLVNDTLGHTKGDDLLKQVAQLLLKLSGPQAVVTRLNGDEFVVVLPEMTGEDAELLGQQILDHLQTDGLELGAEFNHFRLTLSIGISVYPEDGLTSEELLRHADSAMFAVKRNGKQNVRRYNTADDADTEYRQELARELAGALERQEISLVFQPLYNLKTGELVKAEVLMRWHHPVFGWVSPAAFIPVAEQSGLINALGLWALQQSCGYARLWPDVTLCVNVSVLQLLQSNFAQQITELLNEYDLPARRLELELTETTLMQDNSSTVEALHALKKTGVGLTIDDFGIGYSNLARLRTLPVRTLKMDQSFTRHLAGSELDQRYAQGMINAVVQVSAIAGLHVTAEGIETFEQLQTVRALGCHSGQGYFLARPCNAQQFEAMLRNPIPTWATA
ncbi:putative bifunctional diguanylate cyclase/phosphodiesterase [Deinococcus puniceus]|uniref:putative bifunctional diguanylate cyclase/phosphodiesterase n=1 Tax=Deinococcus puniceus TaxID=1182568 RepID=UPI0009EE5703